MEETPITTADTLNDVERQLAALAQKLSSQIEALSREDDIRREALDDREDDLRRREMAARAYDALKERALPTELADCLSFADEAALENAVDALEKAFRAAVQQGVEERLLTDAPRTGEMKPLSEMTDEEYYAAVSRNA